MSGLSKKILIAACLMLFVTRCALEREILIPRAKLQESVSKKFPFERDAGLGRVTVHDPEVYFIDQKVGLRVLYAAHLLTRQVRGSLDVRGKIVYRNESGTFHLHELTIADLVVNEEKVLEKYNLQKIVGMVVADYLDGFRLYRLDPRDSKQNLARSILKDVFVRDDNLVLVVGP